MTAKILARAIDKPDEPMRPISSRLRGQLVYFASPAGSHGVPELGDGEYWFTAADVEKWLVEGVFYLVSPLDTANMTEVELSEEQEEFLGWLNLAEVRHVRIME
jgi:hypothetical protein